MNPSDDKIIGAIQWRNTTKNDNKFNTGTHGFTQRGRRVPRRLRGRPGKVHCHWALRAAETVVRDYGAASLPTTPRRSKLNKRTSGENNQALQTFKYA